jgi:AcrR family transcriptional regulator
MSSIIPNDALMQKVELAFLAHGYEGMTMITLAKEIGMSRRSVYNYFHDKQEAFRAVVRWGNAANIAKGQMAAAAAKAEGASALEVLVAFMDARFADTRRAASTSPYAVELAEQVFRRCRDILVDVAVTGQERLAEILIDLQESGLVQWRPGYSPALLSQFFHDAVRGVNQTLPPRPAVSLPDRYREIFTALLGGVATKPATKPPSLRAKRSNPSFHNKPS